MVNLFSQRILTEAYFSVFYSYVLRAGTGYYDVYFTVLCCVDKSCAKGLLTSILCYVSVANGLFCCCFFSPFSLALLLLLCNQLIGTTTWFWIMYRGYHDLPALLGYHPWDH